MAPDDLDERYARAARWLEEARAIVAFSGAGASAESGIATFRDPGGIWERFDPLEVATPGGIARTLRQQPARILEFMRDVLATLSDAAPNAGHLALGTLEQTGRFAGVITQNVDGLHQEAGSSRVIELHGNTYRLRCVACGRARQLTRPEFFEAAGAALAGESTYEALLTRLPRCRCGDLLRMDVVLFGEAVQDLAEAYALASKADLMLVIGTSGQVSPAAELPAVCASAGGRVIVVNPHENAYTGLGGVFLPEPAAIALPELARRVVPAH